jgi:putative tryptophan/tyrosine transport system substrate-binding protein
MKRRDFIAGLGSAVAWPMGAPAQVPTMLTVGYISISTPDPASPFLATMRQGLSETGLTDGRNLRIEYRFAEGDFNKLPTLAKELIRLPVDLIITATGGGTTSVLREISAVSNHTNRLPGGKRPGQGRVGFQLEPAGRKSNGRRNVCKRVGIEATRIPARVHATPQSTVLHNPTNAYTETDLKEVRTIAKHVGQQIHVLSATSEHDFAPAFAEMIQDNDNALLVMADPFFYTHRQYLVSLAAQVAIPAIYEWREFVTAGGLMSYGSSLKDATRQLGVYGGKNLEWHQTSRPASYASCES